MTAPVAHREPLLAHAAGHARMVAARSWDRDGVACVRVGETVDVLRVSREVCRSVVAGLRWRAAAYHEPHTQLFVLLLPPGSLATWAASPGLQIAELHPLVLAPEPGSEVYLPDPAPREHSPWLTPAPVLTNPTAARAQLLAALRPAAELPGALGALAGRAYRRHAPQRAVRVALYARTTPSGPVEHYLEDCRRHAAGHGWRVAGEYVDRIPHGLLDQPRLNDVLAHIEAAGCHRVDGLLTCDTWAVTASPITCARIRHRITAAGAFWSTTAKVGEPR
ncbi:hypothetical protein BIV57_13200 [Mangrovactinospora gilvigrisea]|uniref:Resolvase/invertase-type recombinase catalytic domain-containing protein n=1 Tax=Mangrovactinospora gilvigrisea TaxID=1428644 RepID=A0A1J7C5X1_9ACTN|nr:recombinase family protein [Mangrovactinospora gilvigrisea]OIV36944.1 hypothetical protein BIV57_13200 [Mangrovactinospora gilvigrisea]